MLKGFPIWFWLVFAFMMYIGIMTFAFTAEKCGIGKTLLLGKNGAFVAAAGMCD